MNFAVGIAQINEDIKKKLKCTLVQALRLCTGRTAHKTSRGMTWHMTMALEECRGQRHAPAVLYPGKEPVPIVQEAGLAPRPV